MKTIYLDAFQLLIANAIYLSDFNIVVKFALVIGMLVTTNKVFEFLTLEN